MDPFSLLALTAAAGFVLKRFSSHAKNNSGSNHTELTYSKSVISTVEFVPNEEVELYAIEVLPEYLLVRQLVKKQFPMVFVTGGAGTGKSTFIKWMLNEFNGTILLGAPTGIAAINIGGKTLHSLCGLPPAFILKKDIQSTPRRREIVQAKLLIIDEISMVTANLLDGVSAFFRLNRGIDQPFGGLPVIMVGDMFQLPPVVDASTRKLFEKYYTSAKFYNARCLIDANYYAIELNKTFRQTDQIFVDVLTKIREGIDIANSIAILNSECTLTITPPKGAVWLSPRNAEVDRRNSSELSKIKSPMRIYKGKLEGNFKSDRLASPLELVLKCGAQVMFTKNDSLKRWINGTTGVVKILDHDNIVVELTNTRNLVDVGRSKWEDFQYSWSHSTSEIERTTIGCYTQFPLILAWAITIHKSQGRTIEQVHLDLGAGAFETGQTYVALSRCRSISGLSMTRPLIETDIRIDHESKEFYDGLRTIIKKLPPNILMQKLEFEPDPLL